MGVLRCGGFASRPSFHFAKVSDHTVRFIKRSLVKGEAVRCKAAYQTAGKAAQVIYHMAASQNGYWQNSSADWPLAEQHRQLIAWLPPNDAGQ